jgi:hypothetical protein
LRQGSATYIPIQIHLGHTHLYPHLRW